MEYRRLDFQDIDKVIQMVKDFRSLSPLEEKVQEFLENHHNYIIACLLEGRVIGFVLGYELQRYDNQNNMMYLHEVGVMEEYKRQGIGKELMKHVLLYCRKKELSKMFLITNKSNLPAVALYEATGGQCHAEADDLLYWYDEVLKG